MQSCEVETWADDFRQLATTGLCICSTVGEFSNSRLDALALTHTVC